MMGKLFNVESLVRNNVLKLKPYSSARHEFDDDAYDETIFVDANENPYDNGLNRYPDPNQTLVKQGLSKLKQIPQSHILLGNGSDEVLDLIFRAFCEPRVDNVITLPPTYGMYKVLAEINDIENQEVLLSKSFKPNVDAILEVINKQTKIIFLCSPNNPTGNSFSEKKILRLLKEFNGLIVLDEAYIDFSEKASWLNRIQEFPNLIITQTFSKAFGLAGIRLGICYASSAIISILNKIKPPYNVNELTQQRAIKRIENFNKVKRQISYIKESKHILYKQLLEIKFVKEIYQSDANFLLIKVDNAAKRYEQFKRNQIVVRNRSDQPLCENTLRITIGTLDENKQLIKAMKKASI